MKFLFLIVLFTLPIIMLSQTQLDIQGSITSTDTVANIKVNYIGENEVVGLSVYSQSGLGYGVGAYFYGGLRGVYAESGGGPMSGAAIEGRSALQPGVVGRSTNNKGVYGYSQMFYGVHGRSISDLGIYGISTNSIGVKGESTDSTGVYGESENFHGILGKSIDGYGVYGESESTNGIHGKSTAPSGFYTAGVFGEGVDVPGLFGISTNSEGVSGLSINSYGVSGFSTNSYGVSGFSEDFYGIRGRSSNFIGGYFRGGTDKADIILGGSDWFSGGDDGVIMSEPDSSGSDIFLVANDAVIIELDNDGNETGNFYIWDDGDNTIFEVRENGNVIIDGNAEIEAPVDTDPDLKLHGNGVISSSDLLVLRIDDNDDALNEKLQVINSSGIEVFAVYEDGDVKVNGAMVHSSDRNRKENISSIDYSKILNAIENMPIYKWNYKGQDRTHIGPMAQDFHTAFGLGKDDTTIASIDADGIALAAIKAQQVIIENLQNQLNKQQLQIDELKTLLLNVQQNDE